MKKFILLLTVLTLIAVSMPYATASDFEDDAQFLIIYQPYASDFVTEYTSEPGVMVNVTLAEYNSTDLSGYTTEELVVFVLNNRWAMASMVYFGGSNPYENAKSYYHGLSELEEHEDAEEVLLRAYNALANAEPESDSVAALYQMRMQFIDLVLHSSSYAG